MAQAESQSNSSQDILIDYMLQDQDYIALAHYLSQSQNTKDPTTQNRIRLAQAILEVDLATIQQLAPQLKEDYLLRPNKLEQSTYAYFLYLSLQLKRQEYMDYLRGLTPILVNIFRLLIEKDFMPNLSDYMEPITKASVHGDDLYRGVQWSETKIMSHPNIVQATWEKYYGKNFDYDQYVSSSHLLKLIETHSKNKVMIEKATQMRQVEKLVRNIVAHEVVYVNEAWIESRCHLSPMEIHRLLFELMGLAGLSDSKQLQVISHLNEQIQTALKG